MKCTTCFHQCEIPEGGRGFCRARICENGKIRPENYGCLTSLALDPIEKKPLYDFHPGSLILSAGSYGYRILLRSPSRSQFCPSILGRRVAPFSGIHPPSHWSSSAFSVISTLSLSSAALSV